MTKSMTAFARESSSEEQGELTWELRSVNHRYLEVFVRLPEDLRALDPGVRERVASHLGRGKLDCSLRYLPAPGASGALQVNYQYLKQLLAVSDEVGEQMGQSTLPSPLDFLRWPGVMEEQRRDLGSVMRQALELLDVALRSLVATRAREGERLSALIAERCTRLSACVLQARERMPQVKAEVRQRLLERLEELQAELDSNRLEQELALMAQRLDVDEEMDRMAAHIEEVHSVLGGSGPVGRRLDFLMQELNREANTLGSKSSDLELTRVAMEMKVLVEQMREQAQNIE